MLVFAAEVSENILVVIYSESQRALLEDVASTVTVAPKDYALSGAAYHQSNR